jgi:hypothetical protein
MPRPHYYTNGKAFTGTSTVSADNFCEVYITYQTASSKHSVSTCTPTHTSYRLTHKLHTTHHVASRAVPHALTDSGLATAKVASPSLNVVWSRYRCCWPLVQHLNTGDGTRSLQRCRYWHNTEHRLREHEHRVGRLHSCTLCAKHSDCHSLNFAPREPNISTHTRVLLCVCVCLSVLTLLPQEKNKR